MKARSQLSTIALLCFIVLGLVGCWKAPDESAQASPQPTTSTVQTPSTPIARRAAVDSRLIDASNRFSLNLFRELRQQAVGENIFLSPASVAFALSMTYNGATDETQKAMAEALSLKEMSVAELNQANAALKASLENPDKTVELAIANSLWARRGIPFEPDFLKINQEFYGAKVADLDFGDRQAPNTINAWVNENTRGKIKQIIDQLNPNEVMVLINTLYFKGAWTEPFQPEATQEAPFYVTPDKAKKHPLMSRGGRYPYLETAEFQAISLPYGNNARLSMLVFLPKPNQTLAAFEQRLTPENWQQWTEQLRSRLGSITLPRFKQQYSTELKTALSALGMGIAFDANRATFGKLSSVPTKIDQVQHVAVIAVDEAGTEAAAATAVRIGVTSAPPPSEPFEMIVNRPFWFAIRDNQTKVVLFLGAISDPQS